MTLYNWITFCFHFCLKSGLAKLFRVASHFQLPSRFSLLSSWDHSSHITMPGLSDLLLTIFCNSHRILNPYGSLFCQPVSQFPTPPPPPPSSLLYARVWNQCLAPMLYHWGVSLAAYHLLWKWSCLLERGRGIVGKYVISIWILPVSRLPGSERFLVCAVMIWGPDPHCLCLNWTQLLGSTTANPDPFMDVESISWPYTFGLTTLRHRTERNKQAVSVGLNFQFISMLQVSEHTWYRNPIPPMCLPTTTNLYKRPGFSSYSIDSNHVFFKNYGIIWHKADGKRPTCEGRISLPWVPM